ncbi:MAG: A/G-specific adenine glycosylase [Bacteroidetes bacterium GWF2_49_14]|nr:MAG: A/G-specific adenine glycosylase [Bacteroidetes bacterium GWF2_49_14]HBB91897.1 A/G-specific adenine glycosylase [Bacteroidales bacterium]
MTESGSFAGLLLAWYDLNKRSLPWRGSKDPYRIWISEIIFQQTRIGQGTSYYLRFIDLFPDIQSLAEADEDQVLGAWQGLGYYSRARNLLYTARLIMEKHAGVFPVDFHEIAASKGVGNYTASCIASICYGQVEAAVDGNVYRVLSRMYADFTPVNSGPARKRFRAFAQDLIDPERPGDFNEAMMDLGSMLCTPRSPKCNQCPVRESCKAFALGVQTELPVKTLSQKRSLREINYLLVESAGQLLIKKRKGPGIWQGLYDLPESLGRNEDLIKKIMHPLSHVDLSISFYKPREDAVRLAEEPECIWIPKEKISQYPFPKPLADFLSEEL